MSSFIRHNAFGNEYLDVTLNNKKSLAKGKDDRFESYIEIKKPGLYKVSTSGRSVRSSKGDYSVMKMDVTPARKIERSNSGAFGSGRSDRRYY